MTLKDEVPNTVRTGMEDLVPPASVVATKEGREELAFDMHLGPDGNLDGDLSVMTGRADDGGDGGPGPALWIGIVAVVVLVVVAYPLRDRFARQPRT